MTLVTLCMQILYKKENLNFSYHDETLVMKNSYLLFEIRGDISAALHVSQITQFSLAANIFVGFSFSNKIPVELLTVKKAVDPIDAKILKRLR